MAPVSRCPPLDPTTHCSTWTAADRRGTAATGHPLGPREPDLGDTGGSTANFVAWVTPSRHRRCGRSSGTQGSTRPVTAPDRRGPSSSAPKPRESLPPTSYASTPRCSAGSMSCSSSRSPLGACTSPESPEPDRRMDHPIRPQPVDATPRRPWLSPGVIARSGGIPLCRVTDRSPRRTHQLQMPANLGVRWSWVSLLASSRATYALGARERGSCYPLNIGSAVRTA